MLRVLTIRDYAERAKEIGDLHGSGIVPAMAELLINAEENPAFWGAARRVLRETGL